jgi:hypothetical protein
MIRKVVNAITGKGPAPSTSERCTLVCALAFYEFLVALFLSWSVAAFSFWTGFCIGVFVTSLFAVTYSRKLEIVSVRKSPHTDRS